MDTHTTGFYGDLSNIIFKLSSKQHLICCSVASIWLTNLAILHNCCKIEPRHEKTQVLVSDPVRQKPGCTATEDG